MMENGKPITRIACLMENAKIAMVVAIMTAHLSVANASGEACALMASMNPMEVKAALRQMGGPVLGKYPDLWTQADFDNVIENARSCHGRPDGNVRRVSYAVWRDQMKDAAAATAEARAVAAAAREGHAPRWTWGEVPSCISVLGWIRDPVWHGDNSAEIFGIGLANADERERTLVSAFARDCLPVMEESLKRQRKDPEIAGKIVHDIATAAIRAEAVERDGAKDLPAPLKAFHAGRLVPLEYLGEGGRKAVAMAAEAHIMGRRLTTEEMVTITAWADSVTVEEGPAAAYAEVLKAFVARNVFGD